MRSDIGSDQFKIAIIGTGSIAKSVATAVRKSKGITVSAVASRDINKAEEFAKKNRIEKAYGSYNELIDSKACDLIYVATVNTTHYEIAKKCLESGMPVLVEKPICLEYEQVEELISLSQAKGVFLAEAMPLRYSSNMKLLMDLINKGDIGRVRLIVSNIGINSWDVPRIRENTLGGGALNDLGVYGITLSDMVFPTEEPVIDSNLNEENSVDAQSTLILTYKDAQSILFNSVRLQTKGCAVIYGDRGRLFIHKAYSAKWLIRVVGFRKIKVFKSKENRYLREIECCRSAIISGKIEPDEYKHDKMALIYRIMEAARGKWNAI